MKLLIAFLVVFAYAQAQAETIRCSGSSDIHQISAKVTDVAEDNLLSDYSVQLSAKNENRLLADVTFRGQGLVYGRGMSAVKDTETFNILKLIFDGKKAVAMYTLVGEAPEQVALTCDDES